MTMKMQIQNVKTGAYAIRRLVIAFLFIKVLIKIIRK